MPTAPRQPAVRPKARPGSTGKATGPSSRQQMLYEASRAQWRTWDWSKQDAELAAEMGLSRERIRQIRRLLGVPKSPYHHQRRASRKLLQWAKENLGKLRGLSWGEIRQEFGSVSSKGGPLYRFLKQQKILRDTRWLCKHPWSLMDFALPNHDLVRIWRLRPRGASDHRYRKRHGPARWSGQSTLASLKMKGHLRDYLRAVKAEEQKAQRYCAQPGTVRRQTSAGR